MTNPGLGLGSCSFSIILCLGRFSTGLYTLIRQGPIAPPQDGMAVWASQARGHPQLTSTCSLFKRVKNDHTWICPYKPGSPGSHSELKIAHSCQCLFFLSNRCQWDRRFHYTDCFRCLRCAGLFFLRCWNGCSGQPQVCHECVNGPPPFIL